MTKAQTRVGNPAEQAVPWGQGGGPVLPNFSDEGQAQVAPANPDAAEPFEKGGEFEGGVNLNDPRLGNAPNIVANEAPTWKPEPQQSPFDASVKTKSPFAPKVKPVIVEESKFFPLTDDDPTWLGLVQFCQKHGENIIQARYPHPRGECIDTIYRGVTVFAHETTQVRHVKLGWIDWKDAIYE